MSTTTDTHDSTAPAVPTLPWLEAGDHLDQTTFHARYEAMPPGTRAELVGGMVIMPSPMKLPNSRLQRHVSSWLNNYEQLTPGVEGGDGATIVLGDTSSLSNGWQAEWLSRVSCVS